MNVVILKRLRLEREIALKEGDYLAQRAASEQWIAKSLRATWDPKPLMMGSQSRQTFCPGMNAPTNTPPPNSHPHKLHPTQSFTPTPNPYLTGNPIPEIGL
jgi:hypothetical protein